MSTSCTQTISTNHAGTIVVPSGTFLCIARATQTGAIDVDPGVGGAEVCGNKANVPAPVNDGLTNTATGAKLHQCATL